MFIKIENAYVNLSMVTGVYEKNDGTCVIYYINKKTFDLKCGIDEFIKEVERQVMLPINKLIAKSTIEDRFELMDLDLEE